VIYVRNGINPVPNIYPSRGANTGLLPFIFEISSSTINNEINMFNKEKQARKEAGLTIEEGENETIIGPSVKVDGDFLSEGNVLVQGVVNGSLKTKGNLRVGEGAKIKANIDAHNAIVEGEVKGNVSVQDNLELGGSAVIEGDIITKILSIEPGAILNGHCSVSAANKAETEGSEPRVVKKTNENKKED